MKWLPNNALITDAPMSEHDAEAILCAWGAHLRREAEEEVGLPSVSPSCAGYQAPPWPEEPPRTNVSEADVERACWAMLVMASRHKRLHRDGMDHYRDGARLGYQRANEIRGIFSAIWAEWEHLTGPTNAL